MGSTSEPTTLLTIEPTPENPRNSEGAFLLGRDGSVSLAYTRFTGGARDNSAAHISLRRSRDGGRTWGPDRVLVETEGRENVMSVSLARLPSGEALLVYAVKDSWGDCRARVRRSADDLATLSAPTGVMAETGYYVVNNDRIVRLTSGRFILPASLHPCPSATRETWDRRGIMMCFLSDDEGRTWRRSRTTLPPPAEAGTDGFQEPGVIERHDGRLWMFIRTASGFQWQSCSADGGETWDKPTPSPLASPLSPASVKRIPRTGDLLAVWNDHSGRHPFPAGRRTPLCVAVSRDDGKTWSPSRVVEDDPDGCYCYTAIEFLGDRVLLAYCAGDRKVGGLNRLRVKGVPVEWIYGGA